MIIQAGHAAHRGVNGAGQLWRDQPSLPSVLAAACEALDMIVQPRGGAEREPAVLRLPVGIDTDVALQVIAGTGDPPAIEAALVRAVRKRLSTALELTQGRVYLAGWHALTRTPWGERALALAELASNASQVAPTCFGSPPPRGGTQTYQLGTWDPKERALKSPVSPDSSTAEPGDRR